LPAIGLHNVVVVCRSAVELATYFDDELPAFALTDTFDEGFGAIAVRRVPVVLLEGLHIEGAAIMGHVVAPSSGGQHLQTGASGDRDASKSTKSEAIVGNSVLEQSAWLINTTLSSMQPAASDKFLIAIRASR
jgi:hypothetical protein